MKSRTAILCLLVLLPLAGFSASAQNSIIESIAGGGPTNLPAMDPLIWPSSVLAGPSGEVYVAGLDSSSVYGRVYRISPGGTLTLVAGNGWGVPWGDGGPAEMAGLGTVFAMVLDPAGNLYLAEWGGQAVRRVDAATGTLSTVAGGGPSGATGDGIPATEAFIGSPYGIAFDVAGNLFLSQEYGHKVRRVDAVTGLISTVAGTGTAGFAGDGGPATGAMLDKPREIAFDVAGNLYIADAGNRRVRKIEAGSGNIVTVAGTGIEGFEGDGGPATAANFFNPSGLAVDGAGNLYISDYWDAGDGPLGGRVRRVDVATGIITIVAGGGGGGVADGIPATDASMYRPDVVDVDTNGDILVADYGNIFNAGPIANARVRRVEATSGLIFTLAGGAGTSLGDGGLATDAGLNWVTGAAYDAAGNLFISTSDYVVRKIDGATGIITLYAGGGACGMFGGDGGPADQACLWQPRGLALDAAGNLYIADTGNDRIRRVDAVTGVITTYAGDGTRGFGGDNQPATNASLNLPHDVAIDAGGDLYIADKENNRIRIVDAEREKIDTFAGDGTAGFGGDGGPATSASLDGPYAVAVDPAGRLLIADRDNFRIRSVDLVTEIISTVTGDGVLGYDGDGGPASLARIAGVGSVAVDAAGGILIADGGNNRIRRVDAITEIIDTVAGNGIGGFSGDGGLSTLAELAGPTALAVYGVDEFVFGDNQRVRRVSSTSLPTGAGEVPDGDPPSETPLLITHSSLGQVILSWDLSCLANDTDYEIYSGILGSFTTHSPITCTTGGATGVTLSPPSEIVYYLVVPRSYAREGSYGRDSLGVERPPAASACIPQEIAACP